MPRLNHIGFAAPSRAALVDIRQRMSEAGFAVPEIQELGSESALFFKDPDGMRVELTVYGDGAN
jgi:catechol-2,3-dioxygenase